MDYTKLSKKISYALRHQPDEFGLKLDKFGFVNLNDLLAAVNCKKEDLEHIIKISEKKRFEIIGDKVRATYGHTTIEKVEKPVGIPPSVLYHGTAHKFLQSILDKGLLPAGRQYVHLSEDLKTATMVGKRRDYNPVILEIDTKAAINGGIKFYIGNDTTWLSDPIPSKYIKIRGEN